MKPCTKTPNGHGSLYKEVRFSPTATPIRRTHSVSTSTPTSTNPEYMRSLGSSYLEHSRSLLERQRKNFEDERGIFAEERALWEQERALLLLRITELESLLKSKEDPRHMAGSSNTLSPPFFPHFSSVSEQHHSQPQVWEGSSPALRPTRVFNDAENSNIPNPSQVSPPAEQGGNILSVPSLDAALSPRSHAIDPSATSNVPVPIEKLDSSLDGITLKSSALPPQVVARVMTPPSPSPLEKPSSDKTQRPALEHKNSLRLRLAELGPPDYNLTRDAGHTPMAVIDTLDPLTATDQTSPDIMNEEKPLAPLATEAWQPAENSDSYFPDIPEDPGLKGPLSLLNEEEHDRGFLKELDMKLLDQARQMLTTTALPDDGTGAEPSSQGESEPELKFKNTTNFGTAFGLSNQSGF